MRWPSDAVSLVGRSLNLDTGKTYKLMRQLREHSTTYLTKLWQLTVDRTGERDNAEARQRLNDCGLTGLKPSAALALTV